MEKININTPKLAKKVTGYVERPRNSPAPGVLVIHEIYGLNDEIKGMAQQLADEGYLAIAVDLYDGRHTRDKDEYFEIFNTLDHVAAEDTMVGWADWLRGQDDCTGLIGAVGWCFGGSWSINAAIATPLDACVVYYGNVLKQAEELKSLAGPVLGHFGTLDDVITPDQVEQLSSEMARARRDLEVCWYEQPHTFANPSSLKYDTAASRLAWHRTQRFLRENLMPVADVE